MRKQIAKALIVIILVAAGILVSQQSARADQWCTPWDGGPTCIDFGGCCLIPWQCETQCVFGLDQDCHCVYVG